MSIRLDIAIIGTKKLATMIKKAEKNIVAGERMAVLAGTLLVEREAKKFVPVDTGRLRASLTHEVEVDLFGAIGKVGSNLPYASEVEHGFMIGKSPRKAGKKIPFLRPALENNQKEINKMIAESIKGKLRFMK